MAEDLSSLVEPGRTPVVDPSGTLGTVATSEVPKVLKAGYSLPDQPTLQHALLEKKYGGIGGQIQAAAAGAGRGATFGLSDVLLAKSGLVNPETLKGLQEANPFASGLGQGVGILGSSLLLPGGGAVGVLGKGAEAVGEGLTSALGEGVVQNIAAKTLGGALEGGFYGAGQSVSEAALGDPTLNAQKVMNNIGIGVLFGGAIGGGVATLGAATRGILGKYGKVVQEEAQPQMEGTIQGTTEGDITGTIKPQGPLKMEGEIKFGKSDEQILKSAEDINPKTPLKQNDLNWIKQNGLPDAEGKPTVFNKLGSEEVPSYGKELKPGQVSGENAFYQDLDKLNSTLEQRELGAQDLIKNSGIELPINKFKNFFRDEVGDLTKGFSVGEGKQAAINEMKKYIERIGEESERLGQKSLSAEDLRSNLQELWADNKRFYKMGLEKPSAEEIAISNVTKRINTYLKNEIPGYGDLMDEYSHEMSTFNDLRRQLKLDPNGNPSIANWFQNRVASPLQQVYEGYPAPKWAKTLHDFSDIVGRDWQKINDVNTVYGKINPDLATGAQRGMWSEAVRSALGAIKNPVEIPGKILGGAAKFVLTGEMPGQEILAHLRAKETQGILLGNMPAASAGVGSRLASSIQDAMGSGSKLLKAVEGPNAVPLGTAMMLNFVNQHENMDHAERKLETIFALERATNAADKKIKTSVNGIFGESEPVEENKKLNDFIENGDHSKEWANLNEEIQAISSNPSLAMDRLSKNIQGLEEAIPNTAASISATAMRSLSFLSQRLQLPSKLPLDSKYQPSKSQIIQAAKFLKTINNPFSALDELKTGNFSRDTKDVLMNVYPELYDHLKAQVMQGIAEQQAKGNLIPNSKRLGLSYFLDQPLETSSIPMTMMKNYAMMMPKPGQPGKVSGGKSTLPSRLLTPMQRVSAR